MVSNLLLMILVLLGVDGTVFHDECPKQEAISPCICTSMGDMELNCFDDELGEVGVKKNFPLDELKKKLEVFKTDYALQLHLFHLNLGTLPTDYFKGFNISRLFFSHCNYEQTPEEEGRVLVGLEDTLQELTFIETIEKHNSPAVLYLSHLNKLSKMHVAVNTIPELSDNWFKKGPSSLTYLSISHNEIEKIGSNAFANLPNLEYLKLDNNQFGGMNRSMLPNPATHLKELRLSDNDLKSLPGDFFTEMPALTILSLEKNDLTDIPQQTFERIWGQLEYIDLSNNLMDCEDSTLKWMVDSKHTPAISGLCITPRKRRSRAIQDIIKELRRG